MKYYHILVLLLLPIICKSQNDSTKDNRVRVWNRSSIQAMYMNGYVFPTNNFLKGDNIKANKINSFQAFSLKFSSQTAGDMLWHQLYNYPNFGAGVYIADFYNSKEIGTPIAVYGFFNAPFKRWRRLAFNYELGFGATFNWKSFDPISNKYNLSIGAGESFMIDAGMNLQWQLTNRFELITGFSLTHFSNGTMKIPNFGINTVAPKITLRYNFYDPPVFRIQDVPRYNPKNEWLISSFVGVINVVFDSVIVSIREKYRGLYFPIFGVSTVFNRQISYKSRFGVGVTVTYNGSINAQIAVENSKLEADDGPLSDKIQLSIYPSYELAISKLSLIFQPAFYLYRKKTKNQSPDFHQRIGFKYYITRKFFMGMTLRDYAFHVADFIEWNAGYRIEGK
jgi:hypothetical protein